MRFGTSQVRRGDDAGDDSHGHIDDVNDDDSHDDDGMIVMMMMHVVIQVAMKYLYL